MAVPTQLWVTSHGIEPGSGVACTKGFCTTVLCLSNHTASCLTAQDVEGAIEAAAAAIGAAWVIYQWIFNRQGKGTAQSKGDNDPPDTTSGGSDDGGMGSSGDFTPHLCLASFPHANDTNDQVYYTSKCFKNPAASWVCVKGANKFDCHWYNVEAADIHRGFELTVRSLRNGAYAYTKPPTSGDWQQWTIFGP